MIKNYYEVTILWGRSGRECARKLADELTRRHTEDYAPVSAFIFEKEALDSGSIMKEVIEKISNSSACIIILTFDDVDKTRVRQNILIETGIAWAMLGKENLTFLSDKEVIPEDFPSNIKTDINTNFFDKENPDETVQHVCNELIKSHKIQSTKDLLSSSGYIFDGRVLDDLDVSVIEGKADLQLKRIIKEWKKSVENFDYLHERIMYVLERVAFFPVFGNDDELVSFMKEISSLIVPTALDRKHEGPEGMSDALKNAMNMTNQVIEYTILKTQDDTKQCMANPLANKRLTEKVERKFRKIFSEIKTFIESFESGEYEYNWLVRIIAYDYAALTKMKMFVIDISPESEENKKDLGDAIEYFEKARKLAERYDVESCNIWLGFVQYNLARAYNEKYKYSKDRNLLDEIKDNLLDAIGYREEWLASSYYKGIFATALSYEYFLASYYDFFLRDELEGYSDETPEENLENIRVLRKSLNNYCDKTELGTLYRMRDKIDELMDRIMHEQI